MTHKLKTVNPHFNDVWIGDKRVEIRFNDRNFQVGDTLVLMEYDAESKSYLDRLIIAKVWHILSGFEGLKDGWVAMSIEVKTKKVSMTFSGVLEVPASDARLNKEGSFHFTLDDGDE